MMIHLSLEKWNLLPVTRPLTPNQEHFLVCPPQIADWFYQTLRQDWLSLTGSKDQLVTPTASAYLSGSAFWRCLPHPNLLFELLTIQTWLLSVSHSLLIHELGRFVCGSYWYWCHQIRFIQPFLNNWSLRGCWVSHRHANPNTPMMQFHVKPLYVVVSFIWTP